MSQVIIFKCTDKDEEIELKTKHIGAYEVTWSFINFMKGSGYALDSILDAMTEIEHEHRGGSDE